MLTLGCRHSDTLPYCNKIIYLENENKIDTNLLETISIMLIFSVFKKMDVKRSDLKGLNRV